MANNSIQTRNASFYWSGGRVIGTRNFTIALDSDFVEDTAHGSTVKTFAPTFANFAATITGLYNTGAAAAGNAAQLIVDAINAVSAVWSIYIGNSNQYFYGSGYISVDEVSAPYDDLAAFNTSVRSIGAVGHYAK
jgi:hypothetical protein